MIRQELIDHQAIDSDTIFLEERYDSAIIGVSRIRGNIIVVYEDAKIVECLINEGMYFDNAWIYFDQNILPIDMGPRTPIFIRTLKSLL